MTTTDPPAERGTVTIVTPLAGLRDACDRDRSTDRPPSADPEAGRGQGDALITGLRR